MAPWQSGDVEAHGIRLHYTRTGGAKPPIVLAHGFTDDGLCWTPVAQALAPDYDVIMVDARGHGQSQAPEHGYGPAEHAADLAGAIAALGLRRPAVLGHSMGAGTALVLAGAYPDVPRAILLEDPPPWWIAAPSMPGADEEYAAHRRQWVTGLKRKTREELIADQRAETPGWSEGELEPWADSKLRLSLNVLSSGPTASVDWPATLRRISCPALLITADPDRGAIITDETAASLQTLVPRLRVTQIADAGHSIRRDQFERYMEVVRAFLRETAEDS
jgi:pimeloyl-ACP methyl ester carboxylesterase